MSNLPWRARAARPVLAAVVVLIAWLLPAQAAAQEVALQLKLQRTFGYSWSDDIQGSFAMIVDGPPGLEQVTFHVDETVLEFDEQPPFQAQLHTGDFPLGRHRLWAEGALTGGQALRSNEIKVNFVAASAGWESAVRMLTPILIAVGLAIAAGLAIVGVSSRRYKPGVYGSAGGATCPNCRLPLSRHFLAPNLGVGRKLERCPHCGKWSRVRRASAAELAAAEDRLLGEPPPDLSPEQQAEETRRQVDDSRFMD